MRGADFFRDEVRCGFYIPTVIKQAWAAVLDVFDEIDRICVKHNIRYFADWGTLLGTVRHGGFVPWDDDLDICMLREDYRRFREVADTELPEHYAIHDYERQKNHWLFLARVVNNGHFCFDESYLNAHYNFPWLAGVDIFVKDYLYRDPKAERSRDCDVMRLIALADGIREGTISEEACIEGRRLVEQQYGAELPAVDMARELSVALYRIAEWRMAEVCPEESDSIGQIFPHILKGLPGQPKKDYDSLIRLPFEDVTMPVPAAYHRMLTARYGNYCEIHKVWGGHNYPFFEGQKAELERVAGEKLPGLRFSMEMLERPVPKCKSMMGDAAQMGVGECAGHDKMRPDEQEKDSPSCVPGEKRRVLFLPVGPAEWKSGLQDVWKMESERSDTDCVIVPLPLMPKDVYGQVHLSEEEIVAAGREDEYPEELFLTHWWEYDVEESCPDVIYIQNPYDGSNPYLTVPEVYFAENLRCYTPEIVYIPIAHTAEFAAEDVTDHYHLKHCAAAPGVIYADRVIVQSDNIRKHYIEALTEFAGEETRDVWEKKISTEDEVKERDGRHSEIDAARGKVSRSGRQECRDCSSKKKVLFAIGIHAMEEYGADIIDAVGERINTFREAADRIAAEIMLYPREEEMWTGLDALLYHKFKEIIDESGLPCREEADVSDYDAYYGSPTPLVPIFMQEGKPVMLADYGI